MCSLISVTNVRAVQTFHPLSYLAPVDSFGPGQRVAVEGESPGHGAADVGPKKRPVERQDSVGKGGNGGPAQGSPEQGRRWNHSTHHIGAGSRQRVADQDSRPTKTSAQKEIQARAVRKRDACDPLSTTGELQIRQLPVEYNLVKAGGQTGVRQRARGHRGARERGKPRNAGHQRQRREGARKTADHSRTKRARTDAGSAVGRPWGSMETSAVLAVTRRRPVATSVIR